MRALRFLFFLLVFFSFLFFAVSQESADAKSDGALNESSLVRETLYRDIKTSSFFQLVEWCRRLGLSDTGARDALESRLVAYYGIEPKDGKSDADARVIELKRAGYALYSSFSEIDENYVLLKNASLFFEDEQGEHSISADVLLYNMASDTLSAYGHVVYVKVRAGKEADRFEGSSLYIRIEDTAGVFVDGASYKKSKTDNEELVFATIASSARRDIVDRDEVIRSNNVFITSSKGKPPYYGIEADRLWLYGGSDWIISNAVLKVGVVPVLYIPFFFYAGDEMVFNPVFGFDDRRGAFVETTTYFIGHKKSNPSDNTFSFMATNDDANYIYEQHGIFYHKIPVATPQENSSDYLKLMLDYYTGLGYFANIEGNLSSFEPFSSLSVEAGLAKSRTLFASGTDYTPYILKDGNLVDNPDRGYFASIRLPVRYRLKTAAKLKALGADIEWNISLFSDPYVAQDFLDRKEDISWKKLMGFDDSSASSNTGGSTDAGSDSSSLAPETTISWMLKSNWSNLPDFSPYFMWNSLSMSNIFAWSAKTRADVDSASPERMFFIPVSISLPSVSTGFTGSIFTYPFNSTQNMQQQDNLPGLFVPWEDQELFDLSSSGGQSYSSQDNSAAYDDSAFWADELMFLPDTYGSMWEFNTYKPFSFSSVYSLTPVWNSIYYYDTSNIDKPEDIDFSLSYAKYSFSSQFKLTNNLNVYEQLFTLTSYTDTVFTRYFVDRLGDMLTDEQWVALRNPVLMQNNLAVTQTINASLKPFYFVNPLKNTALSYSLVALLLDENVLSINSLGEPEYEYKTVEWDKNYIKSHKVTASFAVDLLDTSHSFSSSYVMPPLDESVAFSLSDTIYAWSQTSTLNYTKTDYDWNFSSFTFNQKLNFADNNIQANQLIKFLPEETNPDAWRWELHTLSLKLYYFYFSSTWQYAYPYTFGGYGIGWIQGTSKEFLFSNFTSKINLNSDTIYFWKNRIGLKLGAASTYSVNPIRVTETSWDFVFSLSFFIKEFMSLNLSSSSVNRGAYRYIPGLPEKVGMSWVNPLTDILYSFNIFDRQAREEALFKLQKIDVSLVHDLSDWELSFTYTGSPRIKEEAGFLNMVWDSSFSVLLSWKPIKEIESKVEYKDNRFTY